MHIEAALGSSTGGGAVASSGLRELSQLNRDLALRLQALSEARGLSGMARASAGRRRAEAQRYCQSRLAVAAVASMTSHSLLSPLLRQWLCPPLSTGTEIRPESVLKMVGFPLSLAETLGP